MTSYAADSPSTYLDRSLGAHAAYSLHVHLVWSVRARRRLLTGPVADTLRDHLLATAATHQVTVLALHIQPEHVHLLLSLRPEQAVAQVVRQLKGASSHQLRLQFPRLQFPRLRALQAEALWSTGYFVRSLGDVNVAQAKAYLDRQRAHQQQER